jgi:hypothetical protein
MGVDALEHLRRLVVDDRSARDRLLLVRDREAFVTEVIKVAQECGIGLTPDQVLDGLAAAERRHWERWV